MKSPREIKRAAGLTAAFFASALLLWRAGLRRYESASF